MSEWLALHARPILDSIIYSILGGIILLAFFYLVQKILPFSMRKEIEEDQNISLAIILGSFILGLSLIIASAVHG
jgi:putative membrane protein